jgi:excisionase family DNA binding protein
MSPATIDRPAVDAAVYTISEAAKQLGIHANTLRAYADAGEIHYTRLPSGHRRFSEADLDDFRRRHRGVRARIRPEDAVIEP